MSGRTVTVRVSVRGTAVSAEMRVLTLGEVEQCERLADRDFLAHLLDPADEHPVVRDGTPISLDQVDELEMWALVRGRRRALMSAGTQPGD